MGNNKLLGSYVTNPVQVKITRISYLVSSQRSYYRMLNIYRIAKYYGLYLKVIKFTCSCQSALSTTGYNVTDLCIALFQLECVHACKTLRIMRVNLSVRINLHSRLQIS